MTWDSAVMLIHLPPRYRYWSNRPFLKKKIAKVEQITLPEGVLYLYSAKRWQIGFFMLAQKFNYSSVQKMTSRLIKVLLLADTLENEPFSPLG
ncbi:MAG TPA: hypothetical protein PKA00_13025 [Saprospiraceae bacterium]|nr:hypothetical protein [Saprospiraceae bacterium]HMQ83830.1 hypothetical protein [Saprospiraceae bacterium]